VLLANFIRKVVEFTRPRSTVSIIEERTNSIEACYDGRRSCSNYEVADAVNCTSA
jgi:hypothetical protein